jgi:predicted peroxiredoxin
MTPRTIKEGEMKFLYWVTTGASDATRASIPLHLAVNGSAEVGHDMEIILAGDAAEIILGDNVATIEGVGLPPMRELIEKVLKFKIPVYV